MTNQLALKTRLQDIIADYEQRKANVPELLKGYNQFCADMKSSVSIGGTYGQVNIDTGYIHESCLYKHLLKSAWLYLYNECNFEAIMSASDKKNFDQYIEQPDEFTFDNIKTKFGDFVLNPWGNILRGVAEVFCGLDQAYKSHNKVKIGSKGLPKKVILSGFSYFSDFYAFERLADLINALAAYQGKPLVRSMVIRDSLKKDSEALFDEYGVSVRFFKNGNAHVIFAPETLNDINKALAEYYGDVLPDCHEARPDRKEKSRDIAKDLQFYPTPKKVTERILSDIYIKDKSILEPSCGEGGMLDVISGHEHKPSRLFGVEVNYERAEICRRKGYDVLCTNFLTTLAKPEFDIVVMNPPFYGKHYFDHVCHAFEYLNEGGVLKAVLPITARDDHGLVEYGFKDKKKMWDDLPVGSFSESGTNINTVILTLFK